MRKLWIGAAMAALLVTGCQAGTFHGADGTKNQAVVRESGAGDTAVSGNYVNSADAADAYRIKTTGLSAGISVGAESKLRRTYV